MTFFSKTSVTVVLDVTCFCSVFCLGTAHMRNLNILSMQLVSVQTLQIQGSKGEGYRPGQKC